MTTRRFCSRFLFQLGLLAAVAAWLVGISGAAGFERSPAFSEFSDWSQRFLQAGPAERPGLERQGVELARQRRESLAELIRQSPKSALDLAVPYAVRSQLPPAVAQHLEERVGGRGMLGVIGVVTEPGQVSDFEPITRQVTIGNRQFRAYVYGRRLAQATKMNIPLHGIAVNGVMAIDENPVRVLEPDEAAAVLAKAGPVKSHCPVSGDLTTVHDDQQVVEVGGETQILCQGGHIEELNSQLTAAEATVLAAPDPWSQGDKTLLYIRVRFADQTSDPQTLTDAQTMVNSVNSFFVENSFQTTTVTGTFTPVYTLTKTAAEYLDIYAVRNEALAAATVGGFDYTTYNLDAVRYNGGPGAFSGAAYVHSRGCWLKSSSAGVAAHEFGHNYGLYHANYWNTLDDSMIGTTGTWTEYGDSFDTMGAASAGANHFNTRYKSILNWIPPTGYLTVTANGLYRIYAHDLLASAPLTMALRVPRSTTKNYWVEFRQKWTSNPWMMNGASIRRADNSNNNNPGSELLDMNPGSPDLKSDSPLVLGRTFSDSFAGVHITPLSKGGTAPESLDVVVNVGSFAGNQAPSLSLSASATDVPTGSPVTLTANALDPNGDTLAYYWDFNDKSLSANTVTVSKTWSVAGQYVVRCVASDMKGGVASRWLLVTVGSPSTFRLTGRVTDPAGNPLEGVRVHNGKTGTAYRGGFTDSDGDYMVSGLAAGSYTIAAVEPGYTLSPLSFVNPVTVGPDATGINFTAAAVTYFISGQVTEAGLPLANAQVTDGLRSALSDANGNYTLANVPNGSYTLSASKSGYTLNPNGWANPVVVNGAPVTGRNFTTPTYTISGQITGVSATTVVTITDGYRTTTSYKQGGGANAKNVFSLTGVPAGTWNVRALLSGASLSPTFTNPLTVAGNTTGRDFALDSAVTYSISGSITSATLATSGVTVSAGSASSISDSRGAYYISRLSNGSYTLVPSKSGYSFSPASSAVTVAGANVTGYNFAATAGSIVPSVTIAATDADASEPGSNTATFTITRSGAPTGNLTVFYSVAGSATPGTDFQSLSGSVTLDSGLTSGTITVVPINDSFTECPETVVLTLLSNPNYTIGAAGSATAIVTDDRPVVQVMASTSHTAEGATTPGVFTLIRSGCLTAPLAVQFTTGGTAQSGSDYQSIVTSVTFAANSSSASIQVVAVDDAEIEGIVDETVTITLVGGASYQTGLNSGATVSISDNDFNRAPTVSAGGPQSINLLELCSLVGSASDDGLIAPLTTDWTQTGLNPGGVWFDSPQALSTTASFTMPGTYTLQLDAWDGELRTSATTDILVARADPSRVVRAINAGGLSQTGPSGIAYETDGYFSGGTAVTTLDSIADTEDSSVYQSQRTGAFSYSIPVANGNYIVFLKFAVFAEPAVENLLNVRLQGQIRIPNLDVFAEAGGAATALDVAVGVSVTTGRLDIDFDGASTAAINAIVIAATQGQPSAPSNLVAVGGKKKVTLTWSQSASPAVTQNRIYRAIASGGPYLPIAAISAATSYNDTRLTTGTLYYYVVTALNSAGVESLASAEAFTTVK